MLPLLAYIDPGTGSYIIQMLIAGVLGFLFIIRQWLRTAYHRIVAALKKDDDR